MSSIVEEIVKELLVILVQLLAIFAISILLSTFFKVILLLGGRFCSRLEFQIKPEKTIVLDNSGRCVAEYLNNLVLRGEGESSTIVAVGTNHDMIIEISKAIPTAKPVQLSSSNMEHALMWEKYLSHCLYVALKNLQPRSQLGCGDLLSFYSKHRFIIDSNLKNGFDSLIAAIKAKFPHAELIVTII
jgi:hypothetical protein